MASDRGESALFFIFAAPAFKVLDSYKGHGIYQGHISFMCE